LLTPNEARSLAHKFRHAGEAADRLATIRKWLEGCSVEHVAASDVRVTWGLGSAVPGYDDLTKIVSKLAAPLIPDLIQQAIQQLEDDLHIARRALPAPPAPR